MNYWWPMKRKMLSVNGKVEGYVIDHESDYVISSS